MERPVHFEIHASDPERMVVFYRTVFGWEFQKWDGPMEYWMITTGTPGEMGINGGLVRRKGPNPSPEQPVNAFVCTVGVENVDATVQKAVAAGATVALPKMPIPGLGWLAYIKDPDGNLLGTMQPDASVK